MISVTKNGDNRIDIHIKGKGSHAARPNESRDALLVASSLAMEAQTILSRNIPADEVLVMSITQIHAGAAYNVVPETATLAGTIRYFKDDIYDLAAKRLQRICDGFALSHDVEITLDLHMSVWTRLVLRSTVSNGSFCLSP